MKRLPLPFQRASGLGCTPSKKRSQAKLLKTEGIIPPSRLGDFFFDFILPLGQERWGEIQLAPSPTHPLFVFSLHFPPFLIFFFCNEDRRLRGDAFAMAFVLGLGEHWHGETPRWRDPGLGFPPSPLPCPCSWRRCAGSSRPTSEMDMGTSWKPQQPDWGRRRTWSTESVGVPGPPQK